MSDYQESEHPRDEYGMWVKKNEAVSAASKHHQFNFPHPKMVQTAADIEPHYAKLREHVKDAVFQ
jgi:hypothetical protein